MNAQEIQDRANRSPFTAHLQLEVRCLDANSLTIRMPMRMQVQRIEGVEQFHGGAIATLIDVAGVYAVAVATGNSAPTVQLSVEYLKSAFGPWVDAIAKVRRSGRSLARVDIEVFSSDKELVALGRATYLNA